VSEKSCRLNANGISAKDELLKLRYPEGCTNRHLAEETGIKDAKGTIPKILGPTYQHVRLATLQSFFERLIEALEPSEREAYLEKHGWEPTEGAFSKGWSDRIPEKLYDVAVLRQPQRAKRQQSKSQSKDEVGVIDLLWYLDYKHQERTFEDAMESQSQCIAFSIAAPCSTTQRWLLNRLLRQVPNREKALTITINLRKHPMRHDLGKKTGCKEGLDCPGFWKELSDHLGTHPQQDQILKQLCHEEVDRPVILTIHNFRQFEPLQQWIVQEFWEKLHQEISKESKRSERSRFILFLVDECAPCISSRHIENLDLLTEISQRDVQTWLNRDEVAPCFPEVLTDNELMEWNWADPWQILDKMCFKFGLEDGVVAIEESWKWAS
jgi:hypothetical protein